MNAGEVLGVRIMRVFAIYQRSLRIECVRRMRKKYSRNTPEVTRFIATLVSNWLLLKVAIPYL